MNLCILMVEIIEEPQLRHRPDGLELTEMVVQFPSMRAEEPPATLKAVGWGNLANEIYQNYHQGDRVLIEGRLNMNTIPHPEGYKEKRAELTVQRIHALGTAVDTNSSSVARTPSPAASSAKTTPSYEPPRTTSTPVPSNVGAFSQDNSDEQRIPQSQSFERSTYPAPIEEADPDDIPF
ncbi:hypothetical protein NUACC21_12970 [Scytonema sp. NUACC21]